MNKYNDINHVEFSKRKIDRRSLVLLFALALLPRATGLIGFWNGDEPWGMAGRVLTGELSAGVTVYPPLTCYLIAASYVALYAIGRLVGVWHGTGDFRAQYFHDPTPFMLAGRLVAACLGALSAPLAALIASRLGLTRRSSLIVGGMVALLPINIWLSHIAKPDIGGAFAILLLAWSILRKLDNPEAKGADAIVGCAVALNFSFRPMTLPLVVLLVIGLTVLLRWDCKLPWTRILRGLLVALAVCILVWIPMNIGILLDMEKFLRYQRHAVTAMRRPAPWYEIAAALPPLLAGNISGFTAPALAAWLFAPFIRHDRRFLILWGSLALAYALYTALAGGFIVPRYFFMYIELAFALGCIAILRLCERKGPARLVGLSLAVAVLACTGVGSIEVVRQAMTIPISVRCSAVIRAIADPERDKILAAVPQNLGVSIDPAAQRADRERLERLAKKYGVTLPEFPIEKATRRIDLARGYYVRPIPYAPIGIDRLPPEVAAKIAMPSGWPIQEEELNLDYWTDRGFNIFVLSEGGVGGMQTEVGTAANYPHQAHGAFEQQIKERCDPVASLTTTRYLFGEEGLRIYRLRDDGSVGAGLRDSE